MTGTYCGKFTRTSKGSKSYGGYANFWRGPAHFTVAIPANVDPAEAAPMMCGGTTVYTPLKQYGAGTTAKDVGIVGIGGLGHFAVLFAAAMGANVTAISHSHKKDEDAKKLGASKVIVTGDDAKAAFKDHARSLDLIIVSSSTFLKSSIIIDMC
jgi:alcohol dehydrogenase (NADP+)